MSSEKARIIDYHDEIPYISYSQGVGLAQWLAPC